MKKLCLIVCLLIFAVMGIVGCGTTKKGALGDTKDEIVAIHGSGMELRGNFQYEGLRYQKNCDLYFLKVYPKTEAERWWRVVDFLLNRHPERLTEIYDENSNIDDPNSYIYTFLPQDAKEISVPDASVGGKRKKTKYYFSKALADLYPLVKPIVKDEIQKPLSYNIRISEYKNGGSEMVWIADFFDLYKELYKKLYKEKE